ncbi:MAG: hypothetical protein ACKO8I_14655 [Cyanobacteriota bacterium]
MPRPSIRYLAGWLVNTAPARWSRWAPRWALEAAYRQLLRRKLEGIPGP